MSTTMMLSVRGVWPRALQVPQMATRHQRACASPHASVASSRRPTHGRARTDAGR
jgi:hypothetical protein